MPLPPALSDHTYERFRTLILERSGLHFPEKRRPDLERGLLQACSETAGHDLEEYFRLLHSRPTDGPEWERLIGHLTVGETYFFRDRPQFDALQQHVLPEIIARKGSLSRQLRIWSAGCSSGEEPYSLAILLHELLPDLADWKITILATDINREALQRAQRGRYGDWSFREPAWEGIKTRYFARRGQEWEVSPSIREMISWAYLNLVEDAYPSLTNNTVAFDLIVCRNVTIYFTPELTQRVVGRLREALVEGGWLVVGHSEPAPSTYAPFEAHSFPGTILYRKTPPPTHFDLSWLTTVGESAPRMEPAGPAERPPAEPTFPAPARRPLSPQGAGEPSLPPSLPLPSSSPTADELCAEARELMDHGRPEEALERLRHALRRNPACAQACYLVGKIRANAGFWEEARGWCERALECDPLLTEAHFLLALIHSQEGNLNQALAAMKRVVYLERNAALGHFCLANLYWEIGNGARARKSWENAWHLLRTMPAETPIPWSDGMTAGRLLFIVRRQMAELEETGDSRQIPRNLRRGL